MVATMTDPVQVEQVDRDAATDYALEILGWPEYGYARDMRSGAGRWDEHRIVQAFARHRIAVEARLRALIDPENPENVERVARAIAVDGFGRPWDDFYRCYARDTDQNDLEEYATAALRALLEKIND